MVEVFLPELKRLQTIHHGSIKTSSRLDCQATWNEAQIEAPQIGLLVPRSFVLLDDAFDKGIGRLCGDHSA